MIHVGGYHEYRGGTQITKDNISHGAHDIPHSNEYPKVLNTNYTE